MRGGKIAGCAAGTGRIRQFRLSAQSDTMRSTQLAKKTQAVLVNTVTVQSTYVARPDSDAAQGTDLPMDLDPAHKI